MENEGESEELVRLREEIRHLRANVETNVDDQSATTSTAAFIPAPEIGALMGGSGQHKFNMKLPPFMTNKPAVWFQQVEYQFRTAGIEDDAAKFYYIAGQLDPKLSCEVEDIIMKPPAKGKYKRLKDELIKRLSLSQEQRLRHMLGEIELGSRKPSQFLRHLQSIAGTEIGDEKLLRQLWLRRLPIQAQTVLAALDHLSLTEVAEMADKIVELSQPYASLHAASSTTLSPSYSRPPSPVSFSALTTSSLPRNDTPPHPITGSSAEQTISELVKTISDLSRQVASLSNLPHQVASLTARLEQNEFNRIRNRSFSKNRNHNNRSRSSSPNTQPPHDGLCYYHQKFRERAYKCKAPCTWTSGNSPSSQ